MQVKSFGFDVMHYLTKRCIALGYVLGCLGYTLMVGLSPWALIVWFLFYRK